MTWEVAARGGPTGIKGQEGGQAANDKVTKRVAATSLSLSFTAMIRPRVMIPLEVLLII